MALFEPALPWNEASFGPSKKNGADTAQYYMLDLAQYYIAPFCLLRPKDASFQGNAVSRQRGFEQRHIYLNIV